MVRSKNRIPAALEERYATSRVESQDGSGKGSKRKVKSKSSIIDEIENLTKDPQNIPTTPEAEEMEEMA